MFYIFLLIAVASANINECLKQANNLVDDYVQQAEKYLISKNIYGLINMAKYPMTFDYCGHIGNKANMFKTISDKFETINYLKYSVSQIILRDPYYANVNADLYILDQNEQVKLSKGNLIFRFQRYNGKCEPILTRAEFNCESPINAGKTNKRKIVDPAQFPISEFSREYNLY